MEQLIINTAIENLKERYHIEAKYYQREFNDNFDATFTIYVANKKLVFCAEVKKELRQYQVERFLKLKNETPNFILIAEHIFPKIKTELREHNIAYLETNGNLFIKDDEVFVFIETPKKERITKQQGNRAFTKTGLKVIFHFLLDKDLINLTHREIAEMTNVGLGNIPQVIQGLKETGYLLKVRKNHYVWENRVDLLNHWIDEYGTTLKPRILRGQYTYPGDWQGIPLNPEKTVWGGEPAADILTNHLRPEKFILYTDETREDFIKNYRLRPKRDGEIQAIEKFWTRNYNLTNHKINTAPPLLVYADLMLEGGKRNLETANKIYKMYVEQNL